MLGHKKIENNQEVELVLLSVQDSYSPRLGPEGTLNLLVDAMQIFYDYLSCRTSQCHTQETQTWQNFDINFCQKFQSMDFQLTVDISLSAVHRCMRSPILTRTAPEIGLAGLYCPFTGSTCRVQWHVPGYIKTLYTVDISF